MIQFIFPLTLVLAGLMAGIHFANILGYLPALGEVEAKHIVPFWKKADEYFGRRMPVFGIILLICFLLTVFLFRKESGNLFFWLLIFSLLLHIADIIIAIKINIPVNKILRAWQGGNLPENFEAMRAQALSAFYGRAVAAILSFLTTVLGYILWNSKF